MVKPASTTEGVIPMYRTSIPAVALGALVATAAVGQIPPPSTNTPPASAAGQGQVAPPYAIPTPLYHKEDIARALNATPDQIRRLDQATAQTEERYRTRYNAIPWMFEGERVTRFPELTREYLSALDRNAHGVFDQTQWDRYQQLAYQYGGFETLYDPAVQRRLSLTPAQIGALHDLADWSYRQQQLIAAVGPTDAARAAQLYRDYWQQRKERLNAFLTPGQQRVWAEMTGPPYEFRPSIGR
jgi:hypothetical protein